MLNGAGPGTDAGVIAGIAWAVANKATYGIRVINLSFGNSSSCSSGTEAISAAVNAAAAAGIVIAVAAGNSGPTACTINSPGGAADALTVGAMADTGQNGFFQAYFSSRGPTLATAGNPARVKPDVSAPGWNVVSASACLTAPACLTATHNEFSTKSGTSMATPFVAGAALLMLDAAPTLTPAQIKAKIMATAIDWGVAGTDNDYGAGRLDAYAALASAGAALTAPPPAPGHATWTGPIAAGGQVDLTAGVASGSVPLAATAVFTTFPTNAAGSLQLLGPGTVDFGTSAFELRQEDLGLTGPATGAWTVRLKSLNHVTGAAVPAQALAYVLDVSGGLDLPAVSGSVLEGQTLTGATGTWSGASSGFVYAWQRCDAVGAACAVIGGATSTTYAVAAADAGARLRFGVTVPVGTATATALSAATAAVAPLARTSTAIPTISGTAQDGQTLTATTGTWSGVGPVFTRQWQRCNGAGASCSSIAGATASTYVAAAVDIGSTLRVTVTATNAGGAAAAQSAATAVVVLLPPSATAVPVISDTAQDGQTLTATSGTWVGTTPTFALQWQRCNAAGANCTAIAGATAASYAATPADIGSTLRFAVTGTNAGGAVMAQSVATAVVAAIPPPPPPAPVVVAAAPSGGGGGGGGGGIDPNLEVTISTERPSVVNSGDSFRYIIGTTNLGPGGAQGINLIVDLPAELELTGTEVDRGSGCTGAGTAQLSCFLDFLTPPQVALVKLTVRIRSGTQITLVARATLNQRDSDPLNNLATSVITVGEPVVRPPAPGLPPATTPEPTPGPIRALSAAAVKAAAAKASEATTRVKETTAKARQAATAAVAAAAKAAAAKARGTVARAAAVKVAAAKAAAADAAAVKARSASARARATAATVVTAKAAAARATAAAAASRSPAR